MAPKGKNKNIGYYLSGINLYGICSIAGLVFSLLFLFLKFGVPDGSASGSTEIIIVYVILIFSLLCALIFYCKSIKKAAFIRKLVYIGHKLSSGDLNVQMDKCSDNDISSISSVFYDIATNFQEILLLTGSFSNELKLSISQLEKALKSGKNDKNDIKKIIDTMFENVEGLQRMVKDFNFYKVQYNTEKITGQD